MFLLANNLSFNLRKQSKPACSKIAIPSVVVLLEKLKQVAKRQENCSFMKLD
jgi:hypothetical protein